MLGTRYYLQIAATVVASTIITFTIIVAITSYLTSSAAIGTAYFIFVGVALICILLSLCVGCHGMVKSLLLLGCDQWNIRMVSTGFIIQIVFLCIGLLCFSISLFFIG